VSEAVGVIVMAYGTPASPDDVEAYYTHIRHGRPPEPEQLADLRRRYDAIGGTSPLARRTEAQRSALQRALDERDADRFVVVLGQKHSAPFIEDAVSAVAQAGITKAVGLVLAPHYSAASIGEYQRRAVEAGEANGVGVAPVSSWHLEPAYIGFLARSLVEQLERMPDETKVLFTAHSLPERSLAGDPYPDQLRESAEAIAEAAGLLAWAGWSIAWQSAGRTPEPWRGPDVLDVLRDLGATGKADGALVCPQGFTSDHLEVLYDLDIEARQVAEEAGLAFSRTRSINDDRAVMGALADLVIEVALDAFGFA
jgi:ferrochelatase